MIYSFVEEFDEDNVVRFLEYAETGKIFKKSLFNVINEAMVIDNIYVLDDKNFDDYVYRSGKDVLVYFFNVDQYKHNKYISN